MEASAVSGFLGVALEGVAVGLEGVAVGLEGVAKGLDGVDAAEAVGDGGGAGGEEVVDDEVSVDLEQECPQGLVVACTEVEGFEEETGAGLTAFFMADST